jgi:large subunit ribosomal protein L5
MNQNLLNHYQNIIIYDLLTKTNYKNLYQIDKINKICLNIGFKNSNIEKKKLINIIVLLKLITNQEPTTTKSKKINVLLKIKKNSIVGCKITLLKKNIYLFIEKLIFFILPNIKNINTNFQNQNILNFQIKDILNFFELKTEFLKFQNIPSIDVSIHTNSKNNQQLFLLLNSYNIVSK